MKDFNLKKWMFENKVTKQSALITESSLEWDPKNNPRHNKKNYRISKQPGIESDRERFIPKNGDFSNFDMKTQFIDSDDMESYSDWLSKMNEDESDIENAGSDDPAEVISFHASRLEDALDPDDVSGTVGQFPSTRIQQKIKAQAAKLKGRRVKLTDDQMDDLRSYAKGLMGEENRDLADVAKKMSDENNVDVSGLDQKRMELLGSYILKDLYDMDFEKAMRDNNLPFD